MKEFKEKVAVVTGAASGIGLGLARRCVQEGMRVALADVEQVALEQAEKELIAMGGSVLPVLTDVSRAEQVEALAKKTLEAFGAVHLLFNNAGVGVVGSIWETSLADWQWVMGVDLWGVIHGIRTFVPIMLSQDTECHIVNTSSTAGFMSNHAGATYLVTKHAVVALSEQLYGSLAQRGAKIKASVLCPGLVKTRMISSTRNRPAEFRVNTPEKPWSPEDEEAAWADFQAKYPSYKVISPDQVADAVFAAIREERFYIFTDSEFDAIVRRRMEDILEGRNPTLLPASQ